MAGFFCSRGTVDGKPPDRPVRIILKQIGIQLTAQTTLPINLNEPRHQLPVPAASGLSFATAGCAARDQGPMDLKMAWADPAQAVSRHIRQVSIPAFIPATGLACIVSIERARASRKPLVVGFGRIERDDGFANVLAQLHATRRVLAA